MSIEYKLFGWPRTPEELMDKAERKGFDSVDVVVGFSDSIGMRNFSYHCVVELKAGKARLRFSSHRYDRSSNLAEVVIQKAVIEQEGFQDAIEAAKMLQERGFKGSINGKTIEEIQEALDLQQEAIQAQRQKLAAYL